MKVSKYSFLLDMGDGTYHIFNSLSNTLFEIDKENYDYLNLIY